MALKNKLNKENHTSIFVFLASACTCEENVHHNVTNGNEMIELNQLEHNDNSCVVKTKLGTKCMCMAKTR